MKDRGGRSVGSFAAPAVAVAVALAVGLLPLLPAGCGRNRAADSEERVDAPVLVSARDIVSVESRRLESGVAFTGELTPIEVVEVMARFDGDLERVLVREGEKVRRGQSLAVYRPRDVEDALQSAEASLAAAQAGVLAAQNVERRARRLLDAGAAAPSDLEAAEAQRKAAEASLRAAQARYNAAQEDAERLDVPSPISGSVSSAMVNSGDRTAVGDQLFRIVDNTTLELSATVPSEAIEQVQPGTQLRFRVDGYPGETFEAVVARVSPTTEPGTRQVRFYARVENPGGRLVGGLFASGRVVDVVKEQATAAPIAALRREGQRPVVYRVQDGRARRIPVETGILDETAGVVELRGDLRPGDSLLTGVLPGLRDGSRIQVLRGDEGGPEAAPEAAPPAQPPRQHPDGDS